MTIVHPVDQTGRLLDIEHLGLVGVTFVELQHSIRDVRRILEPGMNVRVMLGRFAGEAGMISEVCRGSTEDEITITTDAHEVV